jgi:hypothetical protein
MFNKKDTKAILKVINAKFDYLIAQRFTAKDIAEEFNLHATTYTNIRKNILPKNMGKLAGILKQCDKQLSVTIVKYKAEK